ncbi:hypothetical protein L6164_010275 [Bauhinia variegata]|uniref:Uncharacterized protein n=1 Tax=Bauhinia variegata TaxID=167791 RepID=A0ACB9PT03_BAUVA|nr:hypothetical protein L6164_010275 [Bauhinia variegata]
MVDPHTQKNGRHKKRRSVIHFLKVALFMIRRHSVKQKTLGAEQGSGSLWRTLVASVRPLHLQSNDSPPRTLESKLSENRNGASSSAFDSPVDGGGYESQSPSSEPESRYSSALDLIQLVHQNDEEEISINDDEDVTIDAKAEEFITQFYEEMRRQRLHYRKAN